MLYALYNDEKFVKFVEETPFTGTPDLKTFLNDDGTPVVYNVVLDRHDWNNSSLQFVTTLAEHATKQFGRLYVPTYNSSLSELGIIAVPAVGDKVSYAFNGDYYPCGTVVRVTAKLTVVTSTGHRFRRVQNTGCWKMEGGTWNLVQGHVDRRSKEF